MMGGQWITGGIMGGSHAGNPWGPIDHRLISDTLLAPKRPIDPTLPLSWYGMTDMGLTSGGISRAQRTWRVIRLAAAALVLFTIAADVVADARCHPAVQASSVTSVSAASSTNAQDPCRTGCVPDCFCCSTLSPGPMAPPVETSGPTVPVEALAAPRFEPGVLPLPYRPPLALTLS